MTHEFTEESILAWAEALESGKYIQGQGGLKQKTPNGHVYCCLGVYCELFVPQVFETGVTSFIQLPTEDNRNIQTAVIEFNMQMKLAQMNDGNKSAGIDYRIASDFKQIAAFIRATPVSEFLINE